MLLFLLGFGCGVVVMAFVAVAIVGRYFHGMQRGIGRALGWGP